MKMMSDLNIKKKGLNVLFRELGEADALRFLSQIRYEKRDYLTLQEELFKGMDVDEIFKRAKEYEKSKKAYNGN